LLHALWSEDRLKAYGSVWSDYLLRAKTKPQPPVITEELARMSDLNTYRDLSCKMERQPLPLTPEQLKSKKDKMKEEGGTETEQLKDTQCFFELKEPLPLP
jgi:hypothetical protein